MSLLLFFQNAPVDTWYLRLDEAAPSGIVLPAGYLTPSLSGGNAAFAGANARSLSRTPGATGQLSSALAGMTAGNLYGLGQFFTPPQSAQALSATGWSIGFAVQSSVAAATSWFATIYVLNGATGAVRATFGEVFVGATSRTSTTEVTAYTLSLALAAQSMLSGDALGVEIGCEPISGATRTGTIFTNGNTAITADNISTASARSFINTSSGLSAPVTVLGVAALSAGGGLNAVGTPILIVLPGASTFGIGSGLTASGIAVPLTVAGVAALGAGSSLAGVGVASPAVVSVVSSFGSGSGLAGAGAAQSATIAGTSSFGAGGSLAAVGISQTLALSGLSSGSGLSAVGIAVSLSTAAGPSTFGSGSGLAAQGVATPAPVSGTSTFGAGANLATTAALAVVAVAGTASLGSGGGLQAAGIDAILAQPGTPTMGSGAGLTAQGVTQLPTIAGSTSFGSGAGLAGQGVAAPVMVPASSAFGVGANLAAGGIIRVVILPGTANLGAGGGLIAFGLSSLNGTAALGGGSGLGGEGVAVSPPPGPRITASMTVIGLISASVSVSEDAS